MINFNTASFNWSANPFGNSQSRFKKKPAPIGTSVNRNINVNRVLNSVNNSSKSVSTKGK